MKYHNDDLTCWNCPAAILAGNVDFRACGQSLRRASTEGQLMIECKRRPELGFFEPTIPFKQCPEWRPTRYGRLLGNMRVLILGIDGYLGWTLALKLGALGFEVYGVDNFLRRRMVREKASMSIVPIASMEQRIKAAKKVLDIDINFRRIDILNREKLAEYLREVDPEVIVHYAEIPSAPYSMVDAEHAIKVQRNNVLGTLGLLFLMRDISPEASLIKLGTMGEYGAPLTGRPLFEGFFPADTTLVWQNREWSLGGEMTPRDPVSFYHVSKVQDTFNVYEACKYWWLRSYDVMQGVIFGVHTDEVAADDKLRTRLDIDEWFGTVVNRFVAQAIIGIPLTLYGAGEQIRGFIALEDAMECMVRLISSPPEPGQYIVVNQVSGLYKLKTIAKTVAKVAEDFGLDVKIQRVENPRVESEVHPFEVVAEELPRRGFRPRVTLEKEIRRMFELLTQPNIVKRIEKVKHTIIPETWWSGLKRRAETIEVVEPDEIEEEGYKPVLHMPTEEIFVYKWDEDKK